MNSLKFQSTVWCQRLLTIVMITHLPNTTPSYFVLTWVCMPGKQGHQISCPLTTSFEGAYEDMVYWQKSQTREELSQKIMEFKDCIRGNDEIIKQAISSL